MDNYKFVDRQKERSQEANKDQLDRRHTRQFPDLEDTQRLFGYRKLDVLLEGVFYEKNN
jgi:hypothetical protein